MIVKETVGAISLERTIAEPWVDAAAVAAHLGFKPDYIRKQAVAGKLPGKQFKNGARAYWRFRISEIDAVISRDAIRQAMPMMSAMADMVVQA